MAKAAPVITGSTEQTQVTAQNGLPVFIRTETQVPQAPPVSKDATFNVTQAGVYLGFIVLLVGAIVSAMRWLDSKLEKLGNRVGDEMKEVKADVKAAELRILDVERRNVELDKNLALQQQAIATIKEGQARIETAVEKNHKETMDAVKGLTGEFNESLRETKPKT
ncbi:hypothetical protein [Sphingomonas oryzagri]